MVRQVVATRPESLTLTLDELANNKGYVMKGNKGDFIIARDTAGNYIWVRLNPTKSIAKAHNSYATLKDAIKAKLDKGFDVFEYSEVTID